MYIKTVSVSYYAGAIQFDIELQSGLNIISGENGTGKTRLLQSIKEWKGVTPSEEIGPSPNLVYALNPKRNAEQRNVEELIQQFRRQNRDIDRVSAEAVSKHFDIQGFDSYPSLGDLFLAHFQELDKEGGDRQENMHRVEGKFNSVIQRVFPEYAITAEWTVENGGAPIPVINKKGRTIPANGLSCGESEIMALVLNLETNKDKFDVFLIDEPEIHLNWHLEKQLFRYLNNFASDNEKQVVVATHSRIIANPEYASNCQFLSWGNDSIQVSSTLPADQLEKLAEEAVDYIQLGGFKQLTVFCEDRAHEEFLECLLESIGREEFRIVRCGDRNNVRSMFLRSQADGGWTNVVFLVDGDNEGTWKHAGDGFHQLSRYCVQNYGTTIDVLAELSNSSVGDIKKLIVEVIHKRSRRLFKKTSGLEFLLDNLEPDDISQERLNKLDASHIFADILSRLGFTSDADYWTAFFKLLQDPETEFSLDDVIDDSLIELLSPEVSGGDVAPETTLAE